jgi:hypothetical protein
LALISDTLSEQARSLSDEHNLSVNEVITQAFELLQHGGLGRHRRKIREYWKTIPPKERSARASFAAKALWEKRKAKEQEPNTDADKPGLPAAASKKAGS